MLPDFIIAGTQKAGTTSLHYYLDQHPDIFLPKEECHYYDIFYHMGLTWYEKRFEPGKGKTIGDETPRYMYYPDIPAKIYRDNPQVKLVFILRNPVDRAYSEYWMVRLNSDEPLSFEEAIKQPDREYLSRGLYAEQIERFLEYFPKEKMFFLITEEFANDPRQHLRNLLQFLDVDDDYEFQDLRKKHTGGHPRSEMLLKLTALPNFFKKRSRNPKVKLPLVYAVRALKALNRGKGYTPMHPETRKQLKQYFASCNIALEKMLCVDLTVWR